MRKKHGLSKTSEYRTWYKMIDRCNNPKNKGYRYYGKRGIKVCKRWQESIHNFIEDMGMRPSKEHTLDRIDNDGDYTPENCRWATIFEQANNRSSNKRITHKGETKTFSQWARSLSISREALRQRIKNGWTIKDSVETKGAQPCKPRKKIVYNGETGTIKYWAEKTGIPYGTLIQRLRNGWSIEKALAKKKKSQKLKLVGLKTDQYDFVKKIAEENGLFLYEILENAIELYADFLEYFPQKPKQSAEKENAA